MNMETYPNFPHEGPAVPLWSVYNEAGWRWDSLLTRFGSNAPLALSVSHIPGEDEIIPDRIQDTICYLEGWTWYFIHLDHTQLPDNSSHPIGNLTWDTWGVGIGSQFS